MTISEFGLHLPEIYMVSMPGEFGTGLANLHSNRRSKPRIPDDYISAITDAVHATLEDFRLACRVKLALVTDDQAEAESLLTAIFRNKPRP